MRGVSFTGTWVHPSQLDLCRVVRFARDGVHMLDLESRAKALQPFV